MEMTRHIRPLYLRAHFNGKPVSKVLVDNGSVVNVMPLRMLRALGRNIGDLIEIEVSVSASTREISKTLGVLPIDIIVGLQGKYTCSQGILVTFKTKLPNFLRQLLSCLSSR